MVTRSYGISTENTVTWQSWKKWLSLNGIFADLAVWKGGILDNGGMVWCKYLREVNDTYGVHTGGVTFWNPDTGNALRIKAKSDGRQLAAKYSQSDKKEFVCTHFVTDEELEPRYNLNRFVHQRADVFTPLMFGKAR